MKQEVENRLQLLITISLFFPVLLYDLAKVIGQSDGQALVPSVQVSILVGFYLLNYVLFQVRKRDLKEKSLRRIGEWLLVAMVSFIVPIMGIVLGTLNYLPKWIQAVVAFVSGTAMLFVLTLPPVIEVVILFSADR
jgi:putative flippase GtrA